MAFGDSEPGDLEDLCRCGWCEECVRYGVEAQMAEHDDCPECDCRMDDCPVCNTTCHYCDGEGYGTVGVEFPCDDPLWEAEGTFKRCPCCHGSGKAEDCTFW